MSMNSSLKALQKFFAESELPANDKWDTLWQDQLTPWDRGAASPALVELLLEKHFPLVPKGKPAKALVPGCGRGYDVVLFAGLTAEDQKLDKSIGLDVSSKAVEEAREFHKDAPGHSEFVKGDFFSETEEWALAAPYDVVYDYAFLCALEPNVRLQWAKRMAEIITPGTGLLIALQYPIDKSILHSEDPDSGPPFLLSPEIYNELLEKDFERIYFERPTKSHRASTAYMMSVWRRHSA